MDRFDLEQQMMEAWSIIDDLKMVYHAELTDEDEIANAQLALITLYQMKFERLFKTFETLVHEGKI